MRKNKLILAGVSSSRRSFMIPDEGVGQGAACVLADCGNTGDQSHQQSDREQNTTGQVNGMVKIHLCRGVGNRALLLNQGCQHGTIGAGVKFIEVAIDLGVWAATEDQELVLIL